MTSWGDTHLLGYDNFLTQYSNVHLSLPYILEKYLTSAIKLGCWDVITKLYEQGIRSCCAGDIDGDKMAPIINGSCAKKEVIFFVISQAIQTCTNVDLLLDSLDIIQNSSREDMENLLRNYKLTKCDKKSITSYMQKIDRWKTPEIIKSSPDSQPLSKASIDALRSEDPDRSPGGPSGPAQKR